MMNLLSGVGLLIGLSMLGLAVVMFARGRRPIHYLWGSFCVVAGVWGLGTFGATLTNNVILADLLWRMITLGVVFIPIIFTHIVFLYLDLRRDKTIAGLYLFGMILVAAAFVDGLVVRGVRWSFDLFYYVVPGPFFALVIVNYFMLAGVIHVSLWRAYKRARGIERAHIRYFLIAGFVGFIGGSFSFWPVYGVELVNPAWPDIAVVVSTMLMSYAIIKLRLWDIRTLARQAVFYGALAAYVYVVFFAAVLFLEYVWGRATAGPAWLLGIGFAIVAAMGLPPLLKTLHVFTTERLYGKTFKSQQTLEKLARELATIIKIDELIAIITRSVRSEFEVESTQVLLLGSSASITMIKPGALTKWLKKSGKAAVRDELREAGVDPVVLKEMDQLGAHVCVPLITHEKLLGVLALGRKKNNEAFSKEDVDLLMTIATAAAVAIENAQLYQESRQFGEKLQREVKAATSELEQANKELKVLDKSKDEFLRIASHQLYTPLTAARGYLSMLLDMDFGKLSDRQREAIEVVEKSVVRLVGLVKDLLDITKIESGSLELNLEVVHLDSLVKEEADSLRAMAEEKNLKIEFSSAPALPPMIGDAARVRQAVVNIIDNAVKYSDNGKIRVQLRKVKNYLELSVEDEGRGLTEDEADRLFGKFVRLPDAPLIHTEGVGLGLYIADQIAREHKGKIKVISDGLGKGSTFYLRLPVAKSPRSLRLNEKIILGTKDKKTGDSS